MLKLLASRNVARNHLHSIFAVISECYALDGNFKSISVEPDGELFAFAALVVAVSQTLQFFCHFLVAC